MKFAEILHLMGYWVYRANAPSEKRFLLPARGLIFVPRSMLVKRPSSVALSRHKARIASHFPVVSSRRAFDNCTVSGISSKSV